MIFKLKLDLFRSVYVKGPTVTFSRTSFPPFSSLLSA